MIPAEWLQYAPKPKELSENEKWNVFLSYRSVNRTWVLNLYDILVELGYKVFIDQCELAAGEDLMYRLSEALRKSQAGILIWSNAASESQWVFKEYTRLENAATKNENFSFVPIKLDKTDLPEFADNRIFIDFSSYPDGPNGGELIRLVHGIVGKPLDNVTAKFANEQDERAMDSALEIEAAVRNGNPEDIMALSDTNTLPWKTTPSLGCKAAESLIKLQKNEEAITILEKLEDRFPKAIRPKQLHALALARVGKNDNLKLAQKILAKLYARGERDPETLGIYARTWMDRYNLSGDLSDLRQSRNYYAEAFEKAPDDYYTGINAASKSVLLGENDKAKNFAEKVEKLVGNQPVPGNYWQTATIAEVLLIQQKYQEAAEMYQKAVDIALTETASHTTTRKQAMLLLEKLNADKSTQAMVLKAFERLKTK